jgi:hypothetical protein
MTKTTRYVLVYTTARICTRVFVYSTGLSVAVKGAKWVNRVAKTHRLVDKSPESITENLFDSLSNIE